MGSFAINRWKRLGLQTVHRVAENVFLFNFADAKSQQRVLDGGPYTFSEHPVMLKP